MRALKTLTDLRRLDASGLTQGADLPRRKPASGQASYS
jgi:hypothetical protein